MRRIYFAEFFGGANCRSGRHRSRHKVRDHFQGHVVTCPYLGRADAYAVNLPETAPIGIEWCGHPLHAQWSGLGHLQPWLNQRSYIRYVIEGGSNSAGTKTVAWGQERTRFSLTYGLCIADAVIPKN